MTGAMSSAIAGLKAHMDKLNVIGNNVANVNTVGYKPGRVLFMDSIYTTMTTGSNGTTTVGGRNPSQIGYGSSIGSIDLDMGTGTFTATGWGLDTMISGDGFFLVGDNTTGGNIDSADPETLKVFNLSRVGNFTFGADGYLIDGQGNVVYGFMQAQDPNPDPNNPQEYISDQLVPIRYPGVDENGDLVWPSFGADGKLQDAINTNVTPNEPYPKAPIDGVSIDGKTGKITATIKGSDQPVTIGYLAIGNVTNPAGVTHESGYYYKAEEGAGDLTITTIGNSGADVGINFVNGSLAGGNVNGENAAADEGLPINMKVGSAGTAKLLSGGLEGSKTDLATEISEMITTQRGYQANTRIITVTDTMLEELVNMKR